eukprot:g53102.t1
MSELESAQSPVLPEFIPHQRKLPRWSFPASFLKLISFLFFRDRLQPKPRAVDMHTQSNKSVLLMLLLSCLLPFGAAAGNGCVESYNASIDYFPHKVEPVSAELFNVEYFNHYKVLTIKNGAENLTYVLYQCGTPMPSMPSNGTFAITLTSVGVTATPILPYLELLGVRSTIDAVFIAKDRIGSSCVLEQIEKNETYQEYEEVMYVQIFNETTIVHLGLEVVFHDGYSDPPRGVLAPWTFETGALHHVEYLKFFGAWFNREELANKRYDEIAFRFECISNYTNSGRELAEVSGKKVLWCYMSYGSWYCGTCTKRAYYCDYMQALGWELVDYKTYDGGLTTAGPWGALNDTQLLQLASAADLWVYPSDNFAELVADYAGLLESAGVTSQPPTLPVVTIDRRGINDWFEGRQLEPGVVLEDLLEAVVGSGRLKHRPVWIGAYFAPDGTVAPVMSPPACIDSTQPLRTQADRCRQLIRQGCVENYNASVDYFPHKVEPVSAELFDVEYFKHYKVLTVRTGTANLTYVLYQCGTPKPSIAADEMFAIPLTSVGLTATPILPYLEMLGVRPAIDAVFVANKRIGSSCVLEQIEKNETYQEPEMYDKVTDQRVVDDNTIAHL